MTLFLIRFLVLLAIGVSLVTLPAVRHVFSEPWGQFLAVLAHHMTTLWDGEVLRHGNVLSDPGSQFAVSVDAECNGIDAVLVLWAAMLAFHGSLRQKLLGIIAGFVALQAMNLVRIVSLFYVGQWDRDLFVWMHHNLWQGVIILWALLVFLLWLRISAPSPAAR